VLAELSWRDLVPAIWLPDPSKGLVVRVRLAVHLVVLVKATLRLPKPLRTRHRDRSRFGGALLVEAALGLAQPAAASLRRRQLGRQLVAAPVAEPLSSASSTWSASARISRAIRS
jgi:hypothetical protein